MTKSSETPFAVDAHPTKQLLLTSAGNLTLARDTAGAAELPAPPAQPGTGYERS